MPARAFAADVLSATGINLYFHAPDAGKDITVNTNLRREVFLIFKESINNIVKHSGAKHARLVLKIADENLTLVIGDDGCGFQPKSAAAAGEFSFADETGGNGVLSIRRRADEMNGELKIDSEIGKGTVITLNLPLDSTARTGGESKIRIK
ncbi:MAG TPA: ATP-binding protein [Pyrinomonadaceae bacterium]